MSESVSLRVFMSQKDVHYSGGLVDGARIVSLFGDVGTELMLKLDNLEGLLAAYERIEFLAPVRAGMTVDVTATLVKRGNTSRTIDYEASVDGNPICRARGIAVAKPLPPA
jgi:3-aminobutyryl-CoA ammonia-lyase